MYICGCCQEDQLLMLSKTTSNLLRLTHDTNTFFFLQLCILDHETYMKKYRGVVFVQYKCKPHEATNMTLTLRSAYVSQWL